MLLSVTENPAVVAISERIMRAPQVRQGPSQPRAADEHSFHHCIKTRNPETTHSPQHIFHLIETYR